MIIDSDVPILETERLLLRKISLDDVEDFYYYASNPKVSKYVSWKTHRTKSETKEFVDFILHQYQNKKAVFWGIEDKETGKMIGTIDFVWLKQEHRSAEIGYILSPDYWGKGLAAETAS